MIHGVRDFTAFAGINNSGKSNVLRALNAFFNGHTDLGQRLNVDDDYYRPDLKLKKAKEISVRVVFELPDHFKFRKDLKPVETLLGSRSFSIEKKWRRNTPFPAYFLNGKELSPEDRLKIDQFLQLINFRYIPNRVLPVDIIRNEQPALRDLLVGRLRHRARQHDAAFSAIQETSETIIQELAGRLTEASPDAGAVRLATPTSWSDMAFTFGYRLGNGDFEMTDAVQGSGVQSLLMLETLYLIDSDYFQTFGWKQADIWAVEEPESSLHTSLEARVAYFLSSIANKPESRLQVLCTTHSDLMVQYSGATILVAKENTETICETALDSHDALEKISLAGISRWVHPILHYPAVPLILVEGKTDVDFFQGVLKLICPNRRLEVACLETISESGAKGGVDRLLQYVKENKDPIKARSSYAPVLVVLDWDAQKKVESFQKLFHDNDPFIAIAWPSSSFNPKLSDTFHGVERHFSDRMIEKAENNGANFVYDKQGVYSVKDKEEYRKVKKTLNEIVREGLEANDLEHAEVFIKEILQKLDEFT